MGFRAVVIGNGALLFYKVAFVLLSFVVILLISLFYGVYYIIITAIQEVRLRRSVKFHPAD